MRFNGPRFGAGFWSVVSVLVAGSISCFTVAASAQTAETVTVRQGVMTERLRDGVMTERVRTDVFALPSIAP